MVTFPIKGHQASGQVPGRNYNIWLRVLIPDSLSTKSWDPPRFKEGWSPLEIGKQRFFFCGFFLEGEGRIYKGEIYTSENLHIWPNSCSSRECMDLDHFFRSWNEFASIHSPPHPTSSGRSHWLPGRCKPSKHMLETRCIPSWWASSSDHQGTYSPSPTQSLAMSVTSLYLGIFRCHKKLSLVLVTLKL